MRPIRLQPLNAAQLAELDHTYRTAREGRLRIRALMVLLAAERGMVAAEVAAVVREHEQTVRRWLVRYQSEGLAGLGDAPRPGAPPKVTRPYREQLLAVVRRRPRALGLPFSLWTGPRLADYLAEHTGIRLSRESVYRLLRAGGVHLSRPQHTITSPDPEYALKRRRSSSTRATT
jgi:transposase